ncbi:MAG: transporter suffix domain-containing protein [Thermodesulfobacteriota bacterium]
MRFMTELVQQFKSKKRERFVFRIGVVFIAFSFTVYLIYFLIPFLPFSTRSKIIASVAIWGVGWLIFSVGLILSGKEGYRRFKEIVKSLWVRFKSWL